MAARFLITGGGSVTWDASNTAIWSTVSGGGTGASVPGSGDTVTMDSLSGGGTVTLGYDPTVTSVAMGTFTGTFASSTFNPTMVTMTNTGTSARTLDMGSGVWTLTGNNTTVYNAAVADNLTILNKGDFQLTYSGGTGTRTVTTGSTSGGTEANAVGFNITAGSDIVQSSSAAVIGNFTFGAGFTGSLANNTRTVYGNLTLGANMSSTSGTNIMTLGATSGTKTITTNNVTINHPLTVNGVGGSFILGDNLMLLSTRSFLVSGGSFDANGKTVNVGNFGSTGTLVRSVTMGSGQWTVTNNSTTVWSCADLTNNTFTPGLAVIFNYSGAAGTRTISHGNTGGGTEANAISINITAGTDIISHGSGTAIKNYDLTGFSGSTASASVTMYRDITFSATQTATGGAQIYSFAATSGIQSITTNGILIDRAVTVNGPGGTVKFVDGWAGSTRGFVFTQGAIDDNSSTMSFGTFTSSVANTRNWIQSGTWNLVNSGATIFNFGNAGGFTATQTGTINFTYSGSVGTRTIAGPTTVSGATEANTLSINITAGTDIIALTTGRVWKTINFTGFGGTWTPATHTMYGGLILSSTMTVVSAAVVLTFSATSGTYNITTTGINSSFQTVINAPGGTYELGSAFVSDRAFTHTAGTFSTNNFNFTSSTFSSNNSNVRTLNLGSSTITITGTGIVLSTATATNLTLNAGTSTIVINDSSATEKEIAIDAVTFYNLYFTGGGIGDLFIRPLPSPVTFNDIKVDPGMIVNFFAGSTVRAASLSIAGTPGDLITLQSTAPGTPWNIVGINGPLSVSYVSLKDSNASPVYFFAYGSVDAGNNTGWKFKPATTWIDVPKPVSTVSSVFTGTPIGLLLALTYPTIETIPVSLWTDVAKPTGTPWTDITKPSGTPWTNVN